MELRDLRCLAVLAEELHFGRAAARLGLAQPPLSQRIRALEEELGAKLFTRTSRFVALTPAGEALWREAKLILAQAEAAAETVRRVAKGLTGRLTVGFVNPAMDAFLAETLARFRELAPDVALSLREMTTPEQVRALAGQRLDVGFLRHVGKEIPGAALTVVSREPYILALPAGHRLTRKARVPLGALDGQPLILPPRGTLASLAEAMEAAFVAADARPVAVQEASSKFTTLSLVASGVGLALLPASVRVWKRAGVVFRQVDGELPVVELAAAMPRGNVHPGAARLIALAVAVAKEPARGSSGPCAAP